MYVIMYVIMCMNMKFMDMAHSCLIRYHQLCQFSLAVAQASIWSFCIEIITVKPCPCPSSRSSQAKPKEITGSWIELMSHLSLA